MRVLLVNQFFHPSQAGTSYLLTDLATHLAALGHDVVVICQKTEAPDDDSVRDLSKIKVTRIAGLRFGRGRYRRVFSYGAFFAGALISGFAARRADVVVTLTTPPLLSVLGSMLKRFKGSRHVSWEMDVYPDIAIEVGVLGKNALPTRALRVIANWSRQYADTVIALGDDMRELLLRTDLDRTKVLVAENWSDSAEVQPGPFPQGRLEVLYAGNLGLAHDVSTVQGAMISCSDADTFRFTFTGGGIHRTALEEFVEKHQLSNVSFRGPYRDNERYEMFSGCHVGLVTQNENVAGSMVPSKIYGMLAAGRPVLYIGPNDTTAAKIVKSHDCGWRVAPGDVNGLVKLLHTLNTNRELIYSAGRRARQALLQHYDRSIAMAKLAPLIVR